MERLMNIDNPPSPGWYYLHHPGMPAMMRVYHPGRIEVIEDKELGMITTHWSWVSVKTQNPGHQLGQKLELR